MKKVTTRRPFPYRRVAALWSRGRTIAEIAKAIGRIDEGRKDGDLYHSLRNFLRIMHNRGYADVSGEIVKLPYRVKQTTVRSSSKVGTKKSP
jgi:hypothetical protein